MPTTTYAHFRDVPESAWRWPSFSPAEIACRGTGAIKINTEAMDKLQSLRNRLGKPLIVRSGYRSPSHNRAVGGAPASKHMLGTAFDIAMSNHDPGRIRRSRPRRRLPRLRHLSPLGLHAHRPRAPRGLGANPSPRAPRPSCRKPLLPVRCWPTAAP